MSLRNYADVFEVFADREMDSIGFFYIKEENLFIDPDGEIVFDIYEHVTPNDIFLFKNLKTTILVRHRKYPWIACELIYPDEEDRMHYYYEFV